MQLPSQSSGVEGLLEKDLKCHFSLVLLAVPVLFI